MIRDAKTLWAVTAKVMGYDVINGWHCLLQLLPGESTPQYKALLEVMRKVTGATIVPSYVQRSLEWAAEEQGFTEDMIRQIVTAAILLNDSQHT